jgi:DNA-binding IscR family transcriptional regulator
VLHGGPCGWERTCPLHIPWTNAQTALSGELSNWTLEALARTDQDIESGTHQLPNGVTLPIQSDRVGIRD